AGWWGNKKVSRFDMQSYFEPEHTAEGWQLRGRQVLNMAVLRASLDIFETAGMGRLTQKAKKLSSYLHFVLEAINDHNHLQVITPATEKDSGCQVSIRVFRHGKHILEMLKQNSVIADWKEPDVVRIAAVP